MEIIVTSAYVGEHATEPDNSMTLIIAGDDVNIFNVASFNHHGHVPETLADHWQHATIQDGNFACLHEILIVQVCPWTMDINTSVLWNPKLEFKVRANNSSNTWPDAPVRHSQNPVIGVHYHIARGTIIGYVSHCGFFHEVL